MPIWERAAAGMRAAAPGNKYGRTHWKGWRVIQILHNTAEGLAKSGISPEVNNDEGDRGRCNVKSTEALFHNGATL